MWTHPKLKRTYSGNYEFDKKTQKRVIYLESFSASGKKVSSYKFASPITAKKAGWTYTK